VAARFGIDVLSERRDNSELQTAPMEPSHLTVYLPGLSTSSAFMDLNIGLLRALISSPAAEQALSTQLV